MPNNADYVSTGKPKVGGAVFSAPAGTLLPTSATAALSDQFVTMGYCSDDGISNDTGLTSSNIKAWGGTNVLALQEGRNDIYTFTLIEAANVNVLKAAFGAANVTGTLSDGITVKKNGSDLGVLSWVIDMIMKGGIAKRIVIPRGQVTNVGQISYKDNAAIGYQITLTATLDEAENSSYEYLYQPPAPAAATGDGEETGGAEEGSEESSGGGG